MHAGQDVCIEQQAWCIQIHHFFMSFCQTGCVPAGVIIPQVIYCCWKQEVSRKQIVVGNYRLLCKLCTGASVML